MSTEKNKDIIFDPNFQAYILNEAKFKYMLSFLNQNNTTNNSTISNLEKELEKILKEKNELFSFAGYNEAEIKEKKEIELQVVRRYISILNNNIAETEIFLEKDDLSTLVATSYKNNLKFFSQQRNYLQFLLNKLVLPQNKRSYSLGNDLDR